MPLIVNIMKGVGLHDTSILGEQHVYVQIRIGMQMERTEHRFGTNPHFGDSLMFPGPLQAQQMEVELWANHHITGPSLVGRGVFSLIGVEMMGMQTVMIPLFEQNGQQKGELEVSLAIQPDMMY